MSDKYLIHGATYCGDGTASNEAASAGAAGAWNDIAVFTTGAAPAQGTLSAGDTVHIRSKTGNGANANITYTLTGSISMGSANATSGSWIRWILDAGTVWSGVAGTLTITHSSTTYTCTLRDYNYVSADVQDSLVFSPTSASYNANYVTLGWGDIARALFDFSAQTSNGARIANSSSKKARLTDPHFKVKRHGTSGVVNQVGGCLLTMVNPQFEMTDATDANGIFNFAAGAMLQVFGGKVYGTGATTGVAICAYPASSVAEFYGFQYPQTMNLVQTTATNYMASSVRVYGADSGKGSALAEPWGQADSRNDGNYPTLNTSYPDSANTSWSWKIYPSAAAEQPEVQLPLSQLYTGSAATKTITLELLIANSFSGSFNARNAYFDVTYIDDTTGLPVHYSTRDMAAGALTTSTAAWSATTYGAITLVKRSIAFTTPTTIKQDTPIIVTYRQTLVSGSANDILFVDPAFALT